MSTLDSFCCNYCLDNLEKSHTKFVMFFFYVKYAKNIVLEIRTRLLSQNKCIQIFAK